MSLRPRLKVEYTVDEYFALEDASAVRHEFYRGEIFAMSGGSVDHNRITRNLLTSLDTALRQTPCEAFSSDMRLLIEAHTLYTYPDVMVICGDILTAATRNDTVTNPRLIVDVLSPSTQDYDRGEKFRFYRALPSLQEYVLIHQERPYVEQHSKEAGGWLLTDLAGIEAALSLDSVGVTIPLRRIYDRVTWLSSM
jgi:Uma2 family endonuclease